MVIYAEFIRTPDSEIQQLAKTISRRTGVLIKHEQVQKLFEQHGLKKKPKLQRKRLDCAGSMPHTTQEGNITGYLIPATFSYSFQTRSEYMPVRNRNSTCGSEDTVQKSQEYDRII